MYDFDKVIDRRNTNSVKWDILSKEGKDSEGIIPMWVADMNFPTVPTIPEAIIERAKHPAYGYFSPREEYFPVCY